ncbi:MAG: hypothetical protein QT02_C0009G0008 [archaeon GW2011_AR9]|nr:MAG: hypothetical protein QT02_C0009G0008 [archaeon GW2011_AR9]
MAGAGNIELALVNSAVDEEIGSGRSQVKISIIAVVLEVGVAEGIVSALGEFRKNSIGVPDDPLSGKGVITGLWWSGSNPENIAGIAVIPQKIVAISTKIAYHQYTMMVMTNVISHHSVVIAAYPNRCIQGSRIT